MRSILSTLAFAVITLTACAQSTPSTEYSIKGTCPEGVSKVYVMDVNGSRPVPIDSATVKDGKFALKGEIDAISNEEQALYAQFTKAQQSGMTEAELQKLADELGPKLNDISERRTLRCLEIIKENKDNLIPVAFVGNVMYYVEYPELKEILNDKYAYTNHPALAPARQ